MGTIGTGLFDDDLAADVRGIYRDLIAEGATGADATDTLLRDSQNALANPAQASVFWLALAAAQWECGRLEARVLEQALRVLSSGSDLLLWNHDPKLLRQRGRVLERLEVRLRSPQPRAKKIRKQFKDSCDWDAGELIAYRLESGAMVLIRVVGLITDSPGTVPLCELLDWIGSAPPATQELKRLKVRSQEWPPDRLTDQFVIFRTKANELPLDRVVRLGITVEASPPQRGYAMFSWKALDRGLARRYASLVRSTI